VKIPATVITGFLGAGKTSLIRQLLACANGTRIAVLINEFGARGIDRDLLLGCDDTACRDDDIVELANGCICCTVADEFLPTMEKLLARDPKPDHIVIETSGLALPKPLVQAFNWPEIKARMTVDGVITVIDAPAVADGRFAEDPDAIAAARRADPSLSHDDPFAELFEDQLACADMVLLNKADLLEPAALASVRAGLAAGLPAGAKVVTTTHGALDPRVALGSPPRQKRRSPPGAAITTTPRRTTTTRSSRASSPASAPSLIRPKSSAASAPSPPIMTFCASRASSPYPASRAGMWCRRSARACSATTTATGGRTKPAAASLSLSARRGWMPTPSPAP
jgi:G3E family GTPase